MIRTATFVIMALLLANPASLFAMRRGVKISVGMPAPYYYQRHYNPHDPVYVIAPVPGPIIIQQPGAK